MFLFYLYLYTVILISLTVSYVALALGVNAGLDLALGVTTTQAIRQQVATSVGVFVVSLPLWLGHWFWLRRTLPDLADPRFTVLAWFHRFYLYAVLGLSVLAVLGWGSAAVTTLVGVLIGAQQAGPQAVANFGTRFGLLFISCLLWVFHWQDLATVPIREDHVALPPAPPAPSTAAESLP